MHKTFSAQPFWSKRHKKRWELESLFWVVAAHAIIKYSTMDSDRNSPEIIFITTKLCYFKRQTDYFWSTYLCFWNELLIFSDSVGTTATTWEIYYEAQSWWLHGDWRRAFAKFQLKVTSWSSQACCWEREAVCANRERKTHLGKTDNLIKTMLITLSNDGHLKAEGELGIKSDIRSVLC